MENPDCTDTVPQNPSNGGNQGGWIVYLRSIGRAPQPDTCEYGDRDSRQGGREPDNTEKNISLTESRETTGLPCRCKSNQTQSPTKPGSATDHKIPRKIATNRFSRGIGGLHQGAWATDPVGCALPNASTATLECRMRTIHVKTVKTAGVMTNATKEKISVE